MTTTKPRDDHPAPAHLRGLLRHFADLRYGTHGNGAVTRADKERGFEECPGLCASRPYGDNALDGKPVAIMGASMGMLGTARAQ